MPLQPHEIHFYKSSGHPVPVEPQAPKLTGLDMAATKVPAQVQLPTLPNQPTKKIKPATI